MTKLVIEWRYKGWWVGVYYWVDTRGRDRHQQIALPAVPNDKSYHFVMSRAEMIKQFINVSTVSSDYLADAEDDGAYAVEQLMNKIDDVEYRKEM